MSDISIQIPFWFAVLFIGWEYWPIVVVVALAMLGLAWAARGALRGVLASLAIVALVAEAVGAAAFMAH